MLSPNILAFLLFLSIFLSAIVSGRQPASPRNVNDLQVYRKCSEKVFLFFFTINSIKTNCFKFVPSSYLHYTSSQTLSKNFKSSIAVQQTILRSVCKFEIHVHVLVYPVPHFILSITILVDICSRLVTLRKRFLMKVNSTWTWIM